MVFAHLRARHLRRPADSRRETSSGSKGRHFLCDPSVTAEVVLSVADDRAVRNLRSCGGRRFCGLPSHRKRLPQRLPEVDSSEAGLATGAWGRHRRLGREGRLDQSTQVDLLATMCGTANGLPSSGCSAGGQSVRCFCCSQRSANDAQ